MLTLARFSDAIVAVHIIAVIAAFGVLFVYPLLGLIGARLEPQAVPSFHRLQWTVHMRLSAPALVVVLLAGIYLASDLHQWSAFYVGWGLAVTIVIGGIGGAYISPREKQLIELAQRELAGVSTSGGAAFAWSGEYLALRRRVELARLAQLALAVLTIFFMALRVGGS